MGCFKYYAKTYKYQNQLLPNFGINVSYVGQNLS